MRFRSPDMRERVMPMDITAMVDVVFLLIIFFLTTSSLVELTRERMELPEQPGEEAESETPGLVVNINRVGDLIVEREVVSLDQLMSMVAAEIRKEGGNPARVDLLVRADRDASLEVVNDVAERLAGLGLRSWRLGTHVPLGGGS